MLLFHGGLRMDVVIPWCSLVACCYFLVLFGWMPLFLVRSRWMLFFWGCSLVACSLHAVTSWFSLVGCTYFLVLPTWMLLLPSTVWLDAVIY